MREFITPIERDDITVMASRIDDITDAIEDVLLRVYMFNVRELRDEMLPFVELIVRCTQALQDGLREFANFRKSKTVREKIIEINNLEDEGDRLYLTAMRRLFADGATAEEKLVWTELFDCCELCCDACEDVSDAMSRVIMKTDIEIAQEAQMLPIEQIAQGLGLDPQSISPYGRYKAKLDHRLVAQLEQKPDGKVILVTAISPTPAGEGKTTTSVGLADALHRLGRRVMSEKPTPQPAEQDSIGKAVRRSLSPAHAASLLQRGVRSLTEQGAEATRREIAFRVNLMLGRDTCRRRLCRIKNVRLSSVKIFLQRVQSHLAYHKVVPAGSFTSSWRKTALTPSSWFCKTSPARCRPVNICLHWPRAFARARSRRRKPVRWYWLCVLTMPNFCPDLPLPPPQCRPGAWGYCITSNLSVPKILLISMCFPSRSTTAFACCWAGFL